MREPAGGIPASSPTSPFRFFSLSIHGILARRFGRLRRCIRERASPLACTSDTNTRNRSGQFRLVQTVDRFSQRVIVAAATRQPAMRRANTSLTNATYGPRPKPAGKCCHSGCGCSPGHRHRREFIAGCGRGVGTICTSATRWTCPCVAGAVVIHRPSFPTRRVSLDVRPFFVLRAG